MSNVMIYDIVGTGNMAVPENDGAGVGATLILVTALSEIAGFVFEDLKAWVLDSRPHGGGEGVRSLACWVGGFAYNNKVCPSEVEVDAMIAAIEAKILSIPNVVSVGLQEVNLFNEGAS